MRNPDHPSTEKLELYYFGRVEEPALRVLEEHLLWCQECLDRLEATEAFIDRVRAGLIRGKFDVELFGE